MRRTSARRPQDALNKLQPCRSRDVRLIVKHKKLALRRVVEDLRCFHVGLRPRKGSDQMSRAYRSAKTGRYVSKATAARHLRTTVIHSGGKSEAKGHRSAITGRFVTATTAARHPDTTITER